MDEKVAIKDICSHPEIVEGCLCFDKPGMTLIFTSCPNFFGAKAIIRKNFYKIEQGGQLCCVRLLH
jgi:hypothetical protein